MTEKEYVHLSRLVRCRAALNLLSEAMAVAPHEQFKLLGDAVKRVETCIALDEERALITDD